jgi:hypothetical protein
MIIPPANAARKTRMASPSLVATAKQCLRGFCHLLLSDETVEIAWHGASVAAVTDHLCLEERVAVRSTFGEP